MAKIIIDTTEKERNKIKAFAAYNGYKSMKAFMIEAADEKIKNESEGK